MEARFWWIGSCSKAIGLAVLATLVCSRGVGAPPCGAGCLPQSDVTSAIREAVAEVDASLLYRRLYESVAYQPLWIVDSRLRRQAEHVLEYLSGIRARGLRPADLTRTGTCRWI